MNLCQFERLRGAYPLISLAVGILLIVIGGCQSTRAVVEDQTTPTPMTTATLRPSPTLTGDTLSTTPPAVVTEETEDETITLVLWTVEEVSPEAEGEIGDFIGNTLQAFRRSNPDVEVEVIPKKVSGKGGVLDFLRTAKDVAPSVLPDVAIIDATGLNQAYSDGLIQSLDGKLDRSIVQDLLPAARRMGTINNHLIGVPLGLEMEHAVYNRLIFAEPPLQWSDVLTANTAYLFPAKGVNGLVNDLTLAQYFSAGGKLLSSEGAPTIDEQVLRNLLEIYRQGVENGTIAPSVLEASTAEELWPIYLEGRTGIAQTTVRQYLTDRESLNNTEFTPFPVLTEQDTPVHIMDGWVLVLVTDDENVRRQAAALSLLEWFMSSSNNAAWNNINKSIPTRDTSYQQLANDDPYWEFLAEQLNTAQPQPGFAGYDQLGRIIQQAVVQVISGEATPEEATTTAIDALEQ